MEGLPERLVDIYKPFSQEKIKAAVWGLGLDRASSPDGFPIFFYHPFGTLSRRKSSDQWNAFTEGLSN